MAQGTRLVSDVLRIMRRATSRQNSNDPDSNDENMLRYISDFASLTMPNSIRLFQEFSTLTFDIDDTTDGVYTFSDLGSDVNLISMSNDVMISDNSDPGNSTNWNFINVLRDPGEFFQHWGVNNELILTKGMPTDMLSYGDELTFRTIPDKTYQVRLYGYKKNGNYASENVKIQYDWWMRYLAYGAALDYVNDYNYSAEKIAMVERSFKRQHKLMLTNTHNQIKKSRATPSF